MSRLTRIVIAALAVGAPIAVSIAADTSVVNASQPAPAECMPCGDPADCGPSGFRATAIRPECAPPTSVAEAADVATAIAGLREFANSVPGLDAGGASVDLPSCPLLDIDELNAALEANDLLESALPEFTTSIEQADELQEARPELNVFCEAERPLEQPEAIAGAVDAYVAVALVPAEVTNDELAGIELPESVSFDVAGGAMTGHCTTGMLTAGEGGRCYATWRSGGLLVEFYVGTSAGETSIDAVSDTAATLLVVVLDRLAQHAS